MAKKGANKSNLKTVKWSQIFSFIKFEQEPENGIFEVENFYNSVRPRGPKFCGIEPVFDPEFC